MIAAVRLTKSCSIMYVFYCPSLTFVAQGNTGIIETSNCELFLNSLLSEASQFMVFFQYVVQFTYFLSLFFDLVRGFVILLRPLSFLHEQRALHQGGAIGIHLLSSIFFYVNKGVEACYSS